MSNMAVQMNYGEPSRGMPGLLYDRANYDAVTRRNSAEDGKLFFGCGVVQGAEPGKDITLPATGATAEKFEGVVMYSANTEMDDDGAVLLRKGQQAGKRGRIGKVKNHISGKAAVSETPENRVGETVAGLAVNTGHDGDSPRRSIRCNDLAHRAHCAGNDDVHKLLLRP